MEHPSISEQCRSLLADRIRSRKVRVVADRVGMHRTHLSSWLRGKRDLPTKHLDALARSVGVRLFVSAEPISRED